MTLTRAPWAPAASIDVDGVPDGYSTSQQRGRSLDHPLIVDPVEPFDELVPGVLPLEVGELPRTFIHLLTQAVGHTLARGLRRSVLRLRLHHAVAA